VVEPMRDSGKMTMRVPRYGLATAIALSLPLCSAMSEAAEPGPDTLPIHVIAIQTTDADDQAEALTKALSNAVRATPGWSQGQGDYSLEVLTLSLKCSDPPDASCQSRIADQIRADRYIWGVLDKAKGGIVKGQLHFWVRGKGTTDHKLEYSANLTEAQDESLKKIATEALDKLTDGPPKGEVKVKAGTVAGQVFVDGQPQGALTNGEGSFFIPSGQHELVIKAPGYADMTTTITVKPTSPTDVSVSPVKTGDKTPLNIKRIAGFGALGAGVAFAGVGLFGSLKVRGASGEFSPFAERFSTEQNVCDLAGGNGEVKDINGATLTSAEKSSITSACDEGGTGKILQLIFYPLAAIAGGAGIYLVATSGTASKEKPTANLLILPRFDRTGAKVDVGFRF